MKIGLGKKTPPSSTQVFSLICVSAFGLGGLGCLAPKIPRRKKMTGKNKDSLTISGHKKITGKLLYPDHPDHLDQDNNINKLAGLCGGDFGPGGLNKG